jgi:hypothetical protein
LDGNLAVTKEFLNFFININKLSGGLVADNDMKKSVMQQNTISFIVVEIIDKHFLLPILTTKVKFEDIQIKLSVGKIRAVLKRQNTDVLVPIVPLELIKNYRRQIICQNF